VLRTWRNYQRGGDLRFRDHLVLMFLPMVRRITYRKIRELPAQCDAEDLLSRGTEALIRAIDRYDPGKGATLEQYAWTRVQGAVLDELRDQDWAPRSLRRDERAINLARERLIAGHQHHPNREQLARAVGMTTTKLARRLDELVLVDIASLNQPVGSDDAATIERVDTLVSVDESSEPVAHAERSEAKDACREAFRLLNPQQREVAVLLYTNDWTLREVGERLGVSESRVCQIHARLRECLQLHSELSLLASVG
jgi:RNA polymerase sigma factor for flagellar operon FliA